jgi:hypothetical protein
MARTPYELRVVGLRGSALKEIYTKVTFKVFLPRNKQHNQYLKSVGEFGDREALDFVRLFE